MSFVLLLLAAVLLPFAVGLYVWIIVRAVRDAGPGR